MRSTVLATLMIAAGCGDNLPGLVPSCTEDATWSSAPAVLGGAIQETAAVALDGKIYVLGGFTASTAIVSSVRVFDTATSEWSEGPALPRPLHHINAATVGGTIYVLGALEGPGFIPTGDVFAWTPKTDAGWTPKLHMPVGSERGSAVVGAIGEVIYVAGGAHTTTVATLSAYSTTNDTWDTALPPLPQPLEHGCGGVVGGKLYAISGRYLGNSPLVFEYTPGGAWVEKASIPTARSGIACGICGDQIIVAGGELANNATGVFDEVEVYTVGSDTWTAMPPMITPRHGMGGAVWDGAFYVPGGATVMAFGAVDTHEVLRRELDVR
jgi:N-acetylneuraminic acid mutarotase